ncbi:general secretion pathway protein G [Geothermobacter ehrlichii]|uniref:General secretion pathway protein G n=1 Tax=Geothermobacter ehrlichii TaxID=213224 RepID=A0A5D3WJA9_9BACT|nr:prepilin-type N-terminal cleavage/methylation domain-containing protein [Geothermobacter ehrlichii]TYO99013.1 general secretion pathway protein G [Geothermobacter ehrlichii]
MPGRTVSSRLKEWWPVGGSGQRGFSLVELVLVVSFLGILMMIAIPTFRSFVERARVSRAAADIRAIEKDITSYALDYDRYPNSLSDIHRDGLRDPWGHPYQYVNLSSGAPPRQSTFFIDLNSDYDLYSLGQDGQSAQVISDPASLDDVIRVSDGGWVGKGANF